MYYLNSFLLYSLLGFIFESTVFKNTNSLKDSGVLHGPVTLVYGMGGLTILLIDKYILPKIKVNKFLKIIISFFIFVLLLSLVEGLCGYLCELIFDVEMWNYSSKKFNIGKYMCLEVAPVWGIMGVLLVYVLKPFFDKIIKLIPNMATYFFTLLLLLDLTFTLITK